MTIEAIVQRLNDIPDVPLPPRSNLGEWTRQSVKGVLTNTRYRAVWRYGLMESVYIPDADYIRQRPRIEALKEIALEDLRIIPDSDWFAAQERLKREGRNRGRRPSGDQPDLLPKVLNSLLYCGEHTDQILYVTGPYGRVMRCPACRRCSPEHRYLYSYLGRTLAIERTCAVLADLIRNDADLVESIISACQQEAEARQTPDRARRAQVKQELDDIARGIQFTLKNVGHTPQEQQQSQQALAELRQEQAKLASECRDLDALHRRPIRIPTADEVRGLIDELTGILATSTTSEDPDQLQAIRHIIDSMTDGRIEIHQCGEKTARKGWLEGRCTVRLLPYLMDRIAGDRLLLALCVPKLSFRQMTAGRNARSLALFVGSTSATSTNVHSHSRCSYSGPHISCSFLFPLKTFSTSRPTAALTPAYQELAQQLPTEPGPVCRMASSSSKPTSRGERCIRSGSRRNSADRWRVWRIPRARHTA